MGLDPWPSPRSTFAVSREKLGDQPAQPFGNWQNDHPLTPRSSYSQALEGNTPGRQPDYPKRREPKLECHPGPPPPSISPWRRWKRNLHGTSPAPRYDCSVGHSQTWQASAARLCVRQAKPSGWGKKPSLLQIRTKIPPPVSDAAFFTFLLPGERFCVFLPQPPFCNLCRLYPSLLWEWGQTDYFFLTGLNHSQFGLSWAGVNRGLCVMWTNI